MNTIAELVAALDQAEEILNQQFCWGDACGHCYVLKDDWYALRSDILYHEPEPQPPAESEVPDG